MKCEACEHENVEGAHFCARCGAVLPGEGSAEDQLIGQMIGGRFRIVKVLGEGGMGIVYEAEQQMGSTVRKVAVKTLHAHLSHDPSVAARFHRECGTVAQLEHPNTIKVYDFGATPDGTLYIAMEFVRGQALNALIQESGALPPERVLKILRQITGSLAEAHRIGIIHRDLKPENVVLTERAGEKDVVKLLDFGIAARTESADAAKEQKLTQQGMVLGTPPYMSPEQFTGKALDARSDIYSLGVMAYEMLTGRLPFDATTPWQWATEHMTAQPIPFEASPTSSSVPSSMRQAILRSLEKDRENRQATVTDFYKELAGEISPSQAEHESTGTAAMEAAPEFGSAQGIGTAKTANMPAGSFGATPQGVVAVPAPPAPVRRGGGGGGKGLVIGLASLGGILLIGIVVVAMQSVKGSDDIPEEPLGGASPGPSSETKIEPAIGPDEQTPPENTPPETPDEPDEPDTPPASTGKKPSTTPTPTPPKTTPTPQPQPQPRPTPKPTPPPSGNACAACMSAANSGNISGAASAYNSCSDPGKKATCARIVRNRAPSAAKTAALNGNCGAAKAIVGAANAMGVGSPALNNAVSSCP